MIPKRGDAISALVGGQITVSSDGSNAVYHDGQTPPTETEIDTKFKKLIDDWNTKEYARNRATEYPSVQECVHAILDDTLDALQAKRAEIKTKFPKG
tara:strand:+ start:152 stop:442 length:291 start_codon:yes stop_codon:yes gene_type:complete